MSELSGVIPTMYHLFTYIDTDGSGHIEILEVK